MTAWQVTRDDYRAAEREMNVLRKQAGQPVLYAAANGGLMVMGYGLVVVE